MNESVDWETIALRKNILSVFKIESLEDFKTFLSSRGKHEHIELKIALMLKWIFLIFKLNLSLDVSDIEKEFDTNSPPEALELHIKEIDDCISDELDTIVGRGDFLDSAEELAVLFEELNEYALYYVDDIKSNNKKVIHHEGKKISSAKDNQILPENNLTELLYLCVEYLLVSKLIKRNDIFRTTSKQP